MWVYADYLEVKKDFIPVFSEEIDREQPHGWKSFIAHKGLQDILAGMIRALERGSSADKLSLWIHGAYGTGKTFATFVLKHLLEDPLDSIEVYFSKQDKLRTLWPRFKSLRERGPYLVVYRSSSDHINSPLKLLVEIQQAIKEKLEEKGYCELVSSTIYDTLIEKLTHPESAFDWTKAFEKHRHQFLDFPSAHDVIEHLSISNLKDRVKLLHRVVSVLDKEGFVVADNPIVVKSWLKDVIKLNSLQGIVFFWDEFTDFFRNNEQVSSLNDLAQATAEMPFYLFLVTHRSVDQFQRIDSETRRKIQERFHNFPFQMKAVTAYQLVGQAIHQVPETHDDWIIRRESLWGRIANITTHLLGDEARKEDFQCLIPLHPFSAFMLARISSQFSSSQRTLFKFLKADDPYSFVSFLGEYPKDDWLWFTADGLWDYFFREDHTEFTEGAKDILNYYSSRIHLITDEQHRRVFKAIMLLMVLWRQVGVEELLRPTLNNLKLIFLDTPISKSLKEITDTFCKQSIINAIPFKLNNEEFTIPLITVDQRKIEEIQKSFVESNPFESIVMRGPLGKTGALGLKLAEQFLAKGLPCYRQELIVTSAKDLKTKRERIEPSIKPFQFGVVIVVAHDEDQLGDIEKLVSELAFKSPRTAYVLIQTPFGKKRWEDWVKQRVMLQYCEEVRDSKNADFYRKRSQDILDEWVRIAIHGNQRIYFRDEVTDATDSTGYEKRLDQITEMIFPSGCEKISKLTTLYKTSGWGKTGAEIGLGIGTNITSQYRKLVEDFNEYERKDSFSKKINHPLTKMQQAVDAFFSEDQSAKLSDIWDRLQDEPFGLMPSPLGITLMGFLLKKYAHGYYWTDGVNSFALNPDKLAELIEAVLKGKKGSESYEIRKMAPEHEQLCFIIQNLFNLPREETAYPEEAKKTLRNYITQLGYPIWALCYIPSEINFAFSIAKSALDKLHRWLGTSAEEMTFPNQNIIKDLVSAFDEAFKLLSTPCNLRQQVSYTDSCACFNDYSTVVPPFVIKKEDFEKGMYYFINEKYPALCSIMTSLDLSVKEVMETLKDLMNEEAWLWKPKQVEERLSEIHAEFEFVDALNQLCAMKKRSARDALEYFRTKWIGKRTKLPLVVHAEASKEVGSVLAELCDLANDEVREAGSYFELSVKVKEKKDEIRKALCNGETALTCWITQHLETDITDDEAKEILKNLPNLSDSNTVDELEHHIRLQLNSMLRHKLIRHLQEEWKAITGSDTPEAWSRCHKIPIGCIQEGPGFFGLYSVVNSPEDKTESQLQKALEFIACNKTSLAILRDTEEVNHRFMKIAAGEYRVLIQENSDIESLKKYLYEKLGPPLIDWPMRMAQLRDAVKQWVNIFYQGKAYQKVVDEIDKMPEADAKRFLKSLASDPMVGSVLVEKSSLGKKRS